MRMAGGVVLLVLAQGLAGCGGSGSSPAPSAPSPVPAPSPGPQPVPQPTPSVSGMSGFVVDTAFRPLAGARVEVIDGPQAGPVDDRRRQRSVLVDRDL